MAWHGKVATLAADGDGRKEKERKLEDWRSTEQQWHREGRAVQTATAAAALNSN